ncbi:MAG: NAD(P)/FAD-dependent oxidoreductase [Vulcanibacillus sp.]
MVQDKNIFEITVIGGGPAGLFATFYAGMRGSSVKIIDTMPKLGGQLSALYPEKCIYDIAGFTKIRAGELIDRLLKQASQFNPVICLEEKVEKIDKQSDGSFLLTTNKGTHISKTIIIAAGIGAFEPRKLEVENASKFEATNLHYFVEDLKIFKDKKVLIYGGGDSAVDWALMLQNIAKEVTLIHRRDKFRAHEHSIEKLYNSNVKVIIPSIIAKLEGENTIKLVTITSPKNAENEQVIEVDDVIVNHGFISSLGPISEWGLEIINDQIVVDTTMKTNIDGIYAIGDIANYTGKIKLITAGFGEATTAVSNAKHYIHPDERLQPARKQTIE